MADFGGIGFCCCGPSCYLLCPAPPDVPEEYQIEVAGIGNGSNCGDCALINGVHVLSYDAGSLGTQTCSWVSPAVTVCSGRSAIWRYNVRCFDCPDSVDFCHNRLTLSITSIAATYQLTPFAGYGQLTLPLVGTNTFFCDSYPASITITPL